MKLSLLPVAEWLNSKIGNPQNFVQKTTLGQFPAFVINGQLAVLENLRFFPGEEENSADFAGKLADLADLYVNEAFAVCERAHASVVGVARLRPHFAGLRLIAETEKLSEVLENPGRPLLVILGGAKMETKLPLIKKMADLADNVVVGGKLVGEIKEEPSLAKVSEGLKVRFLKLTRDGKDTTLEAIDKIQKEIAGAGMIVWNGPLGAVEDYTYQVGTRRLSELVAASAAVKVVGGGDTIGFLNKLGLIDKFDWVSTGGGSMLNFLSGEELPGIKALLA